MSKDEYKFELVHADMVTNVTDNVNDRWTVVECGDESNPFDSSCVEYIENNKLAQGGA